MYLYAIDTPCVSILYNVGIKYTLLIFPVYINKYTYNESQCAYTSHRYTYYAYVLYAYSRAYMQLPVHILCTTKQVLYHDKEKERSV